jgi:hypothetical protein
LHQHRDGVGDGESMVVRGRHLSMPTPGENRDVRQTKDRYTFVVETGERSLSEGVLNGLYASPEAGEKVCIGQSVCNGRL